MDTRTMTATAYLEKYFECVDNMPLEVQRHVSRLREVELESTRVMGEIERLRCELVQCVGEGAAPARQKAILMELRRYMLKAREIGDAKLDMSSQMLNIAEEHSQQLDLRAKELDSNLRSDDHHHTPRYTTSHSNNSIKESPLALLSESASEAKHIKRTSSSKRPRPPPVEKSPAHQHHHQPPTAAAHQSPGHAPPEEEPAASSGGGGGGLKENGSGRSRENSTTSIASNSIAQAKPPKKKIKLKKKVAVKEPSAVFLPPSSHVPMPDLTSQPLDPNEPLYCLCHQVSFGEMIGCDNDNCPIEWFHFQCVGLTSKPKGKWFCPKCSQDRKAKASK